MKVMGILNVTPDSFSDGGKYIGFDNALRHAEEMIAAGADIIDIGGESTKPGFEKVSAREEADRVCSVIAAIKERFDIPVSIDSYKAKVVKAALEAGADIANDVFGLRFDRAGSHEFDTDEGENYGNVVSAAGVPVILTHSTRSLDFQGNDKSDYTGSYIDSFIKEMKDMAEFALSEGISKDKIIVDPGIGFGKTQEENLAIMKHLSKVVKEVSYPFLLGTSRKSMIGAALGNLPPEEREEGTLVTTVLAAQAGCTYVRVHDVEKNIRAIKMYEAIMGQEI